MNRCAEFMRELDARFQDAAKLTERKHYSVFYSQVRPSALLILGFNPGGNPETWVESQLASRFFYENGEHEYVDCDYKIAVAMREYLKAVLGLEDVEAIRSIPKSNLIFRRSTGQGSLGIGASAALLESQPFLEGIIRAVSPTHILFEGTTTLDKFEQFYCETVDSEVDGPSVTTPNGSRLARIFRVVEALVGCLGRRTRLLGIGHPSKYAGRMEWQSVLQRSKRALESCRVAA